MPCRGDPTANFSKHAPFNGPHDTISLEWCSTQILNLPTTAPQSSSSHPLRVYCTLSVYMYIIR